MNPDLGDLLDRTARSFAVSVRLLPGPVRGPVGLAYLLARAADTVADRDWVSPDDRERILEQLERGVDPGAVPGSVPLASDATAAAERRLLDAIPEILQRIARLPAADGEDVRSVTGTLVATMRSEIRVFGTGPTGSPVALPDGAALEAYTQGIAGCVGLFWTRLVARHVFAPKLREVPAHLADLGMHFGRGLQLVNVLRDLPRDLRRGRCYLPADELAALGLSPGALLDPGASSALAPVLARWEDRAEAGLRDGLRYTAELPRFPPGLRLATELPARLGLKTLAMLRAEPRRLDPEVLVKVPRGALRGAVAAALVRAVLARR